MLLTLITNKKQVYVNPTNISFVEEITGLNPDTNEEETFSRIYLMHCVSFNNVETPCIDVVETVKQISAKLSRTKKDCSN